MDIYLSVLLDDTLLIIFSLICRIIDRQLPPVLLAEAGNVDYLKRR